MPEELENIYAEHLSGELLSVISMLHTHSEMLRQAPAAELFLLLLITEQNWELAQIVWDLGVRPDTHKEYFNNWLSEPENSELKARYEMWEV